MESKYEDRISFAVARTRSALEGMDPGVVDSINYGSDTVSIWLAFKDEAAMHEAEARGICEMYSTLLKTNLFAVGYPQDMLDDVHIGFCGKAEVDAAGGPWMYFR